MGYRMCSCYTNVDVHLCQRLSNAHLTTPARGEEEGEGGKRERGWGGEWVGVGWNGGWEGSRMEWEEVRGEREDTVV